MKLAGAFPRNLDALQDVFTLAEAFYLMASVPTAGQFPVSFALEELFTNMVKYNPGGSGEIQIDLEYRDGTVRMDLADPDSDPFDLETDAPKVDPDLPLGERKPGGLGVHLIKKLMDRIECRYGGRTATFTLFKRLE